MPTPLPRPSLCTGARFDPAVARLAAMRKRAAREERKLACPHTGPRQQRETTMGGRIAFRYSCPDCGGDLTEFPKVA